MVPSSGDLVLYSAQTRLSFHLAERYYESVHYVWCTPHFKVPSPYKPHGGFTPPSSTPFEIARRLAADVDRADEHSSAVRDHRVGLHRGARAKRDEGVISDAIEKTIVAAVTSASLSYFKPLVFVIPARDVETIVEEVPVEDKASAMSEEYIIKALPRTKFDVIEVNTD